MNRPYRNLPGSHFTQKDPKVLGSQDVTISPDIKLVCNETGLGMTNGSFWIVTGVSPIILTGKASR